MADGTSVSAAEVPDAQSVAEVLSWFSARTGLRTDRHRGRDMALRVARLMKGAGIQDSRCFVRLVESDPAAEAELREALTVQETYFFRDAGMWEVVRDTVLARLRQDRRGMPLRLCSVGCATGEEAYTLAMLAEEAATQVSVLGVDLGPVAVRRAQEARYPLRAVQSMDDRRRRSFLRQEQGEFVVADRIRRRVRFAVLNLADPEWAPVPAGGFDLLVCRNVLVYLTPEAVTSVASRLCTALSPGGWLVLAPTDPWPSTALQGVRTAAGVLHRRPGRAESAPHMPCPIPSQASPAPAPAPRGERADRVQIAADVPGALERATALADAGRSRDALALLAHALEENRCDARLHGLLALIRLDTGEAAAARHAARAAIFLEPHLAVAHLALAAAERSLGRSAAMDRAARHGRRLLDAASEGTRPALAEGEPPGRLRALANGYRSGTYCPDGADPVPPAPP